MRSARLIPVVLLMHCTLGFSQSTGVPSDALTPEALGYQAGFRDGLRQSEGIAAHAKHLRGHYRVPAVSKDPEFQLGYNVGFAAAQNQSATASRRSSSTPAALEDRRAVNLPLASQEGRRIVQAVSAYDAMNRHADCSHVVHEIYRSAGLDYAYASSRELYAGIERFRRVQQPHPGDVIVWPGHAGIVLDPSKGTFYSALSSGPGIDNYIAPYWRTRGRARFYRYAFNSLEERAALKPLPTSPLSASTTEAEQRRGAELERAAADLEDSDGAQARAVVIETSGKKPRSSEVVATILNFCREDSRLDHLGDAAAYSVFVFDQIKVSHLKIKNDAGSVLVKISSTRPSRKESNEARWEIRKRDARWQIMIPPAIAYQAKEEGSKMASSALPE